MGGWIQGANGSVRHRFFDEGLRDVRVSAFSLSAQKTAGRLRARKKFKVDLLNETGWRKRRLPEAMPSTASTFKEFDGSVIERSEHCPRSLRRRS